MGAAVLGVPVKPTIKEVTTGNKVVKTIKRANLWEVQTPQVPLLHCTTTMHALINLIDFLVYSAKAGRQLHSLRSRQSLMDKSPFGTVGCFEFLQTKD